jgi:phospholipid/cholesterol/gamma-HCH transport system ATP-binding protein
MAEPVIECRELVCGYDAETPVLEDVDVSIHRGQITALLGGSGSGKSTLLKTVVGLLPPLSGEVRLLGERLYELSDRHRAELLRRTGMLFQYGALFGSRSILDNVALPLREHTDLPEAVMREMVRQKLALVGIEGLEHRLPADVSGGQRKRVALARAAIMDPEIIFCDEPSAGLDPVVAAGLDRTLRHLQELFGMTMVVVTHELESIKILADRVIMLAGGRIQAIGTVDELARREDLPEVYRFFHRMAPEPAAAAQRSLLAALGDAGDTSAPGPDDERYG